MAILDFYKDVLSSFDYQANKDGMISIRRMDGVTKPAQLDDKRLVLPTTEILKAGVNEHQQAFHPLSENIARRGASEVHQYMQRAIRTALAARLLLLTRGLLELAADTSTHKDLSPESSAFLKHVTDAKASTLETWHSIEKALATKKYRNSMVTVYLKNGGSLKGEKFNRICTVRFPILEELEGKDGPVFGVKCSQKNRKVIREILHYIVPLGDDAEEYSDGSSSQVAPYLDALLKAYAKTAKQFNRIIKRHNAHLENAIPEIPMDFAKHLTKLMDYRNKIPVLPGNQGRTSRVEESNEATEAAQTSAAASTPPPWNQQPQPVSAGRPAPQASSTPTPAPTPAAGSASLSDYLQSRQPPQQHYPPQGQPYPQQGGQYPPQPAPYPQVHQGGIPANAFGGRAIYPHQNNSFGYPPHQPQAPQSAFDQALAYHRQNNGGQQGGNNGGGSGLI